MYLRMVSQLILVPIALQKQFHPPLDFEIQPGEHRPRYLESISAIIYGWKAAEHTARHMYSRCVRQGRYP